MPGAIDGIFSHGSVITYSGLIPETYSPIIDRAGSDHTGRSPEAVRNRFIQFRVFLFL